MITHPTWILRLLLIRMPAVCLAIAVLLTISVDVLLVTTVHQAKFVILITSVTLLACPMKTIKIVQQTMGLH